MLARKLAAAAIATAICAPFAAMAAGPEKVSGPGALPECLKPWNDTIAHFKWPAKKGPYRIALANGFVGNTWRIQMVKTAKAFAAQDGIKEDIAEFKVVSTGTDVGGPIAPHEKLNKYGDDARRTHARKTTTITTHKPPPPDAGGVRGPGAKIEDGEGVVVVE
jgi:ribose transport system substrate-binding protein